MLTLSKSLFERPILSLRTGGVVGNTTTPIINPDNLKIEGLYCTNKFADEEKVLLYQDIREQLVKGFVVDDYEVLADAEDLIRLKDVLAIDFQLLGKPVVTEHKKRLGKVTDFAYESETFYIQKLYVSQSILKNLNAGQLSVTRKQIIEITDQKIVIKDPQQPTPMRQMATRPAAG